MRKRPDVELDIVKKLCPETGKIIEEYINYLESRVKDQVESDELYYQENPGTKR